MGFGLFKKIKDAAKKAGDWLKKALPQAKKVIDAAAPVVKTIAQQAPKYISNEKVKNFLNTADDMVGMAQSGVGALDSAVNNHDFTQVKDWVNYNIKPRLKGH